MLTLMMTNALALTCDAGDVACNTANTLADLVNAERPKAIGDTRSGKRNTAFIEARLNELIPVLQNRGCTRDGLNAVTVSRGSFTGSWQDVDLETQVPTGPAGSLEGSFTSNTTFSGTFSGDENGLLGGDFGRFDLPSGKLAGLRDSPDDFFAGGVARINGQNSVAWAIHGTCPSPTDVAAVLGDYLPQARLDATPECEFDVFAQQGPALEADCGCIEQVCRVDAFCCEVEWDGLCVEEVGLFSACDDEIAAAEAS